MWVSRRRHRALMPLTFLQRTRRLTRRMAAAISLRSSPGWEPLRARNRTIIPISPRTCLRRKRARITRHSSKIRFVRAQSFTITAGLRWDIFGGKTERHNRFEYFNPTATNTFNGVNYTGAEIYVTSGNRSPFTTNMKDFGPRLGVAWQPMQVAGRSRGRRFLLRTKPAHGGQWNRFRQRRFLIADHVECDLPECGWQHDCLNGSIGLQCSGRGKSGAQLYGQTFR